MEVLTNQGKQIMHYKNGREAKNGDLVIGKPKYGTGVLAGIILDIQPGAVSCNATLLRPGGMVQNCVTVGEFFHAEDVIAYGEAEWAKSQAAMAAADAAASKPA